MNTFSKLKFSGKLVFICGIIATLSLFLSWFKYGRMESISGFEQKSYWILVSFIYPFSIILNEENMNKKKASISLLVGLFIWFVVAIVKAPLMADYGSGSYWMLLSLIISLFGVLINKNNTKMVKEKSNII